MQRLLLPLSCLCFLAIISDVLPEDDLKQFFEQRKSPVKQELHKRLEKDLTRGNWNGLGGNGIIIALLSDPEFRAELAMSDAQYKRIQETAKDIQDIQKNPELMKLDREIMGIEEAHGPTLQNADEETVANYLDLYDRWRYLTTKSVDYGDLHPHNLTDVLEMTLTPEQKQKMKEVQLAAALSDVSIFSPNMFEALGLSDAQKNEMEKIKKELDLEFEAILEDIATRKLMNQNKIHDAMEKQGTLSFQLVPCVILYLG